MYSRMKKLSGNSRVLYETNLFSDENFGDPSIFTGFDFDNVWKMDEKNGIPTLKNVGNPIISKPKYTETQSTAVVHNGRIVNPIRTSEDLHNILLNEDLTYVLINDIDLSGVNWQPIGTDTNNAFIGTFDGNGHSIKNLTINSSQAYVGLFGVIKGAKISNLIIESPNVMNTSNSTGALTGWGCWRIYYNFCRHKKRNNSWSRATTGGLIGGIGTYGSSKISQAYSTNQVFGTSYTGGLVGYGGGSRHTFTDVFATGDIKGTDYTGGLLGYTGEKKIAFQMHMHPEM